LIFYLFKHEFNPRKDQKIAIEYQNMTAVYQILGAKDQEKAVEYQIKQGQYRASSHHSRQILPPSRSNGRLHSHFGVQE